MPSCAPSARTAGRTRARARDASLTRGRRGNRESGSGQDGPRGRERRPRDHAAGRGDGGSEDAPAAAEETRAGERAREREGGHGVAHRVRWAVAPEEALPRSFLTFSGLEIFAGGRFRLGRTKTGSTRARLYFYSSTHSRAPRSFDSVSFDDCATTTGTRTPRATRSPARR